MKLFLLGVDGSEHDVVDHRRIGEELDVVRLGPKLCWPRL